MSMVWLLLELLSEAFDESLVSMPCGKAMIPKALDSITAAFAMKWIEWQRIEAVPIGSTLSFRFATSCRANNGNVVTLREV